MAVAYRDKTDNGYTVGTTLNPAIPAGTQVDDVMVATIMHRSSMTSVPSGWTLRVNGNFTSGGTFQEMSMYTKKAVSGDLGTSPNWVQSSSVRMSVSIVSFSGASGNIVDSAFAAQSTATFGQNTYDFPTGITATNTDEMSICAGSFTSISGGDTSFSSGWTKVSAAGASDNRMGVAYKTPTGAGDISGTITHSGISNFPGDFAGTIGLILEEQGDPPPSITSITPDRGPSAGSTAVTLGGNNFHDSTGVTFDGTPATSFVVVNPTTITCDTPAHAVGFVDVVVENPRGDDTEVNGFEYDDTQETRITQIPILAVITAIQPARITQAPLLVVNLPIQGTLVTQVPALTLYDPTPIPLPSPVVPEVPVVETWEYLTVVNTAEGSKEQRSALRAEPKVTLSFNALILSEAERRNVYQMLFKFISRTFDYPNYVYSTNLTESAEAGDSKLFFDPAATDMREGERLALFDPKLEVTTYAVIDSLDADGANLTEPLAADAHHSFHVCPAFEFRTSPVVGLLMRGVDGNFSLKLESTRVRAVERPDASPTLTTYGGMLVLDKRPLADDDVDEQFDQNVTWLDNSIAPPEPRTRWPVPFVGGKRQYLAHRPAGLDYWRAVAAALKGRQKSFLLPTFRDDLPRVANPALSATSFYSTNVQLFDFWRERTYRYLRIVTQNGVIYRYINEVLAEYDLSGQPLRVQIKLNTAFGGSAGDNIISMVSYANVCRLDSDAIHLTHEEVDTIVSIAVKAVNQ